jgi:PncC family amidohydrolase
MGMFFILDLTYKESFIVEQEESGKVIYEETYGIFSLQKDEVANIINKNLPVYKNVFVDIHMDCGIPYVMVQSDDQKHFVRVIKALKKSMSFFMMTLPNKTFQEMLVELLVQRRIKISTAESMTGGLIASTLVSVPNASTVLEEAFIVYSDDAKQKVLDVSQYSLDTYGVCSEEVAREMVEKLFLLTNAEICISVTGIAGPTGGDEKHPVGSVYIGLKIFNQTEVLFHTFKGNRNQVRKLATMTAICKVILHFNH